jgi:hypothetical protein
MLNPAGILGIVLGVVLLARNAAWRRRFDPDEEARANAELELADPVQAGRERVARASQNYRLHLMRYLGWFMVAVGVSALLVPLF